MGALFEARGVQHLRERLLKAEEAENPVAVSNRAAGQQGSMEPRVTRFTIASLLCVGDWRANPLDCLTTSAPPCRSTPMLRPACRGSHRRSASLGNHGGHPTVAVAAPIGQRQ
jgi:hypothetical protein